MLRVRFFISPPGGSGATAFQDMDASEIEICKRPDGSEWVLGSGTYGKVRCLGFEHMGSRVLLDLIVGSWV